MSRPRVTVYTRRPCSLCREAEAVVFAVAEGIADVELIDIDADPELAARYTTQVPVVAVDGVDRFVYSVDAAQLRRLLLGTRGDRGSPPAVL